VVAVCLAAVAPYAVALVAASGHASGANAGPARIANAEGFEAEIVAAINRFRSARGLSTLRVSDELAAGGDAHARALALAGSFGHAWPDGRPFGSWMPTFYDTAGHSVYTVGENLLWTSGDLSPELALRLWRNSASHRRLLMDPDWEEVGVGVVRAVDAGGVFTGLNVYIAAAEFGRRA
jgi:uncharacterized protein YkwD